MTRGTGARGGAPEMSGKPEDSQASGVARGSGVGSTITDSAPAPRVMGLDLSLRHTGIADCDGFVGTVTTGNLRGAPRIAVIWDHIEMGLWAPCDLAVIEGYANAAQGSSLLDLAELGGIIKWQLYHADVTFVVIPPAQLKIYATGTGQANKAMMVSSARERLGYERHDDNEADALWLRALGLDLLGAPVVKLPQTHRRVLPRIPFRPAEPER